MIDKKQMEQDYSEFAEAFGDEGSEVVADPMASEGDVVDEAAMASDTEAGAETPVEDAAQADAEGSGGDPVAVEAPAVELPASEAATEEAAGDAVAEDDADVPPEDRGAFKSWRGRIKKREAELAALAEELAAREAALGSKGQPDTDSGETGQADISIESDEEPIPDGDSAPADLSGRSLAELRGDLVDSFGEEFVQTYDLYVKQAVEATLAPMVQQAVEAALAAKSPEITAAIDSITSRYEEDGMAEHFGHILDAHPDFEEVVGGDAFKSWIADKPEMQECCQHGNKRQVVRMLNAFKEAQSQTDGDEIDDLFGVRPAAAPGKADKRGGDSFSAAWNEY